MRLHLELNKSEFVILEELFVDDDLNLYAGDIDNCLGKLEKNKAILFHKK